MAEASTAGFKCSGHVEPAAANPDAFARVDAVDPETLCGSGAKDGDRFLGSCRIEVVTLGNAGGDRLEESEGAAWTVKALVSIEGMKGLRYHWRRSPFRWSAPGAHRGSGRSSLVP